MSKNLGFFAGAACVLVFVLLVAASTNTAFFNSLNVAGGAFTVDDDGVVTTSGGGVFTTVQTSSNVVASHATSTLGLYPSLAQIFLNRTPDGGAYIRWDVGDSLLFQDSTGSPAVLTMSNALLTGAVPFKLSGTTPYYELYETDAALNEKIWRIYSNGGILNISAVNDAGSAETLALSIGRSGAATVTGVLTGIARVDAGANDSSLGTFNAYGNGTTTGGRFAWYNGAGEDDPTYEYFLAEADGQELRLGSSSDPGLFHFNIAHFTSDVPIISTGDITSGGIIKTSSTSPQLQLYDSDGGADAKRYRLHADSNVFHMAFFDDLGSNSNSFLTATRSGFTVSSVTAYGPFNTYGTNDITAGGDLIFGGHLRDGSATGPTLTEKQTNVVATASASSRDTRGVISVTATGDDIAAGKICRVDFNVDFAGIPYVVLQASDVGSNDQNLYRLGVDGQSTTGFDIWTEDAIGADSVTYITWIAIE